MITQIKGGVCAAIGFTAAGIHCGIRKNKSKSDLALIVSDRRAAAAAVYTRNLVKGAPIYVTQENLGGGYARAVICNSGNANTCNAGGIEIARRMCELAALHTGAAADEVIVASTGVIGQPLDIGPIERGMSALAGALGRDGSAAADAILTTDLRRKEIAFSFNAGGVRCCIGGIAKGSGMINPNMATMLAFLTTDAAISPEMLQAALSESVGETYNMITIDGDTSTNDMVSIMANGAAGGAVIDAPGADFDAFCEALRAVNLYLCREIAADGEGATRLIECAVSGAPDVADARACAKSVVGSSLIKAMVFGADANCGRVLCALGYSGAAIDANKIDVTFRSAAGEILVCRDGIGLAFSEETAKEILLEKEVVIAVNLNIGGCSASAWGCDLTYDYVKINGDYRS